MRGEDQRPQNSEKPSKETPPHARGRLRHEFAVDVDVRNTPACAGKTRRSPARRRRLEKPPRMRGEDSRVRRSIVRMGGNTPACAGKTQTNQRHADTESETPPHARGRQEPRGGIQNVPGNTPACAGKTCVTHNSRDELRKHPRMRGEDGDAAENTLPVIETPPHARGRHWLSRLWGFGYGNTPACAGKTFGLQGRQAVGRKQKHPRMRGEDPLP